MSALNEHAVPLRPQRRHGMSLVELMVGIAVGLFIVAAATTLMANQLSDNRRLLVETQIQQDLRASMDIITRQLRRAGALDILQAQSGLATATGVGGVRAQARFTTVTPAAIASSDVEFGFFRNMGDQGPYRFKLENDGIKTQVGGGGGLHELTDVNVMKVTAFTVTPAVVASATLPCPKLCPDNTAACWPRLVVRDYTVTMDAQAKNDATVRRTMSSTVRLRNDWVQFNGPGVASPVCPA